MCAVLACAPTLPEGWCRDGASRQGGWTREGLQCSGKNERDWAPGRQPGLFTEGPPEPTGQGYPRTCLWLPETRLWVEGPWAEGVGVGRVQATSSLCRAGWRPQRSPWRTEGACVYVCGPCPPSLQPSTSFQDCTVSECATGFRYWLCASCERYGLRPLT